VNRSGVQEILLRYRPGSADERDAEVQAALQAASQEPALGRWLEQHRVFQQTVQHQVRSLAPPPGLKEQILSERPRPITTSRTNRRGILAAAVGVLAVISMLVVWFQPHREDRFATFRSRMVRAALRGYAMQLESSLLPEIRQFLAARNAPADWNVPPGLSDHPLLGCAVMSWQNHPTAMVCYGSQGQPDLWLFVLDATDLPDPPPRGDPQIATVGRLNTVSWRQDGKSYLLAGDLPVGELRQLVVPQG